MVKPPKVAGLILCKRMAIDVATGEMSLVGVFQTLSFGVWPALADPFIAYTALYGGSGEGTMKLTITHLETEEDVFVRQYWSGFSGQGLTVHMEIPVRGCGFPRPGRYAAMLRFDDYELTERYFDVLAKGDRP
jgi:hypothetical protein